MALHGAFTRKMSIKMNKALHAIGVDDERIQIRRKCFLQIECNDTTIRMGDPPYFETPFYFGSQSEVTTTFGLKSDTDFLECLRHIIIVQNVPVKKDQLQMVESPNPGYCVLNDPFGILKEYHKSGTSFVKNSFQMYTNWYGKKLQMEGPAILHQTFQGEFINCVPAFPCISWPPEVRKLFISTQSSRTWPSKNLADQILKTECFVVPKGSDIGENADIEWRLSFSCGERVLMFDLNVVQIRCYILMKYIKATFLDRIAICKGVVTSYICKTVLFHVISQTPNTAWIEGELLTNLNRCLDKLRKFIDEQKCPHFIMPTNNLLARKLDSPNCRLLLSKELDRIIKSNGRALFDIKIDGFGKLLQSERKPTRDIEFPKECILIYIVINHLTSSWLREHRIWHNLHNTFGLTINVLKYKLKYLNQYRRCIDITNQRLVDAIRISVCRLSAMLGSYLASKDFEEHHDLSHEAFQWLLLGLQCSDAASSHLKLASILFFDGDLECAGTLLDDVVNKLSREEIDSCCLCKGLGMRSFTVHCLGAFLNKKTFAQIVRENIGFCVTFLPCEIIFCPKEFQFEMFRTAFCDQNALPADYTIYNNWRYYAVITPEAFLHFMQYKLYKQRCMPVKSKEALRKLLDRAMDRRLSGIHRETTLNLVAQCWEQEGYAILALYAYKLSLTLQPEWNAARILLCCNLYKQFILRK